MPPPAETAERGAPQRAGGEAGVISLSGE